MTMQCIKHTLQACLMALLVGSCGGGGGSVTVASGGIGGTGISAGTISDFGSIFVNGVEFDTSNATIVVDGAEVGVGDLAATSNLAIGQFVQVTGDINVDGNSGSANRVTVKNKVKGLVTAVVKRNITAATAELLILGQTILIDGRTRLDGLSLSAITANQTLLAVSGLRDIVGTQEVIRATHIRFDGDIAGSTTAEVTGFITNLNRTAATFTIANLSVVAPTINLSSFFEGDYAEVRGTTSDGLVLTANSMKLENDFDIEDADDAELEAYVTSVSVLPFSLGGSFIMGTTTVQTNNNTEIRGGRESDIAVNVKLEVEGSLKNGLFIAEKISFGDNVEIAALITAKPDPSTLTMTFGSAGHINVIVNEQTKFSGDVGGLQINTMNDITANGSERAEIRGYLSSSGVVAVRVEVRDRNNSEDAELQGAVDSTFNPSTGLVPVLGVLIDTTTPGLKFAGADKQVLSQSAFLSAIRAGTLIDAQGTFDLTATTVVWEEIEIEEE